MSYKAFRSDASTALPLSSYAYLCVCSAFTYGMFKKLPKPSSLTRSCFGNISTFFGNPNSLAIERNFSIIAAAVTHSFVNKKTCAPPDLDLNTIIGTSSFCILSITVLWFRSYWSISIQPHLQSSVPGLIGTKPKPQKGNVLLYFLQLSAVSPDTGNSFFKCSSQCSSVIFSNINSTLTSSLPSSLLIPLFTVWPRTSRRLANISINSEANFL